MVMLEVFSRYLDAHGKNGDCLLAISTSGTSKNVFAGCKQSKKSLSVGNRFEWQRDSLLTKLADVSICTPAGAFFADRVQNYI